MRKISLKNIIYTYIFLILVVILSIYIFNNVYLINDNFLIIFTFLINGIFIVYELIHATKLGFSLKEITFLFLFIFMFFSPLVQYLNDAFPWWDTILITDEVLLYSNLLILIFMIVYKVLYLVTESRSRFSQKKQIKRIKNVHLTLDIMFFLTVLFSTYIIYILGFSNLFSRSAVNSRAIENQSLSLIIQNTFKAVPIFYVAMNLIYYNKNKKIYKYIPFTVGTIFMILINFPTGTPRFWMASVYIGFFIILVKKINNPHLFKIIVLAGLFIVFPFLNIFRYNSLSDIINISIDLPNPIEAFLAGDYDSYSMLARAIIFSNINGLTKGYQIIGSLFFFIPRSIWPTKPIGSGAMIGQSFNWQFTNVSMPLIGEGYINFGFIGVIIFAIFLGVITSKLDFMYANLIPKRDITAIELIYPFSLGFLFFILRGDLLSSFSFYIGFILPIIFIYVINKFI